MADQELTNGLPAEIVMETSSKQFGEYSQHLFEDSGRVVFLNDNYYIRYEEELEGENFPVTIKISPDGKVSLIRQGEMVNRMTFDSEQATFSQYRTSMGTIELEVRTTDLIISYYDRPFAGRVNVDYSLYSKQEHLGDFQIRLRFTT